MIGAITNDGATVVASNGAMANAGADVTFTLTEVPTITSVITLDKFGEGRREIDVFSAYPNATLKQSLDLAGEDWVGYIGSYVFTGLQPLTNYNYTLVQGANNYSGSFYTNTSDKAAKFSLAFASCYTPANMVFGSQNPATEGIDTGFSFDFLDWYIDNTEFPLLSLIFMDDIYYADGNFGFSAEVRNEYGKQNERIGFGPNYMSE